MQQLYFYKIVIFLIGLCIGSFINVCIYRLPIEKSIISPPSFCPKCKKKIKWYHNIPLFSYIILNGKCAYCGEKISIRYPLIELLTGLVFFINFNLFGFSVNFFAYTIFILLLIVATFVDLEHMIIPDEISIGGTFVGFIFSFIRADITWLQSIIGIILGGGILLLIIKGYFLLTKKEGMGGGDVKLLAMIGAFLGYKSLLFIIFSSSLLGTIIGIPLIMAKKDKSSLAIPFGPFLSLGAVIYIYFGEKIIKWYFHYMGIL